MANMQGQELREIVGENIRAFRGKVRMKQCDLATRVGITQAFMSQIEAGKASPSVDTLAAIAEVLEVPPSFLVSAESKFAVNPS